MIIRKIKVNLKNLFLLIILLMISGIVVLIEKAGFNKTFNLSVVQAQTPGCWGVVPLPPAGEGSSGSQGSGGEGSSGGGSSSSSGCGE